MKKTSQEVKVLAINTLYEYAEKIIQHEKNHFSQYIGIDIFKVDGSVKQKYKHESLTFKGQMTDGTWYDVHSWLTFSRYSGLQVSIKCCVNGGSYDVQPNTAYCQYEQLTSTLFDLDDNSKLLPTDTNISYLSKRYNVAELTKVSEDIKQAAKVYELMTDKMPYIFKEVFSIQRLNR